jgi:hypothetical protein
MQRLVFAAVVLCACQPSIPDPQVTVAVAPLYDPLARPPVLPSPHEATLQPGTAFPPGASARIPLSDKLDPASVSSDAVIAVDLADGTVYPPSSYVTALDPDGKVLSVTRFSGWPKGHRSMVLVLGGDDAAGVRGAAGEPAVASPYIFYLRQPTPILGVCPTRGTDECACPDDVVANADASDFTCNSVVAGLTDEDARVMEVDRRAFDAELTQFVPSSRRRDNVIIGWSFPVEP